MTAATDRPHRPHYDPVCNPKKPR